MTRSEAKKVITARNAARKKMHRMHDLWLKTEFSDPMWGKRADLVKQYRKEFKDVSADFKEALRAVL